jgi:hypothetical protein
MRALFAKIGNSDRVCIPNGNETGTWTPPVGSVFLCHWVKEPHHQNKEATRKGGFFEAVIKTIDKRLE